MQNTGRIYLQNGCNSAYAFDSVGYHVEFSDYPVPLVTSLATATLAAPSGWYLDLVAGTNPSRPVVTPPELIQDLVELPKQIAESWKLLKDPKILKSGRESANQFLNVKFGWLPFIEDLRQLMDAQALILKRNKELKQLYSGRGLRRRLQFGFDLKHDVQKWDFALYGPDNHLFVPITHVVRKRSWGSIHWYPLTPPPYHPDDDANHTFTRNLVYGLTPEGMAKGLWNVIPWTWLIGWFTNFGKYALAYSLTVPATHSGACFMSESVWESFPGTPIGSGTTLNTVLAKGSHKSTTKTRLVSGALTVGFNMPYLDMSRLSVVAALFAQRTLR